MKSGEDTKLAPAVENPTGAHPIVLVCEHASSQMPQEADHLGLSHAERVSHIAWDPGAFETAKLMSGTLDAPLVFSNVSRLIYDCNRPPDAESAMPERSEDTLIPGNASLSLEERQSRIERYYRPFEQLVSETLDAHSVRPVLVTIHSFTPVFKKQHRSVEIGVLHDRDSRLADALMKTAPGYDVQRNVPYGPDDGVTHTLCQHGLSRGILNVMIEIRSDLIARPEQCRAMADTLCLWLSQALETCAETTVKEAAP